MKRHAALIPLSHDHHEGLILARLIQNDAPPYKGLPTDLPGKVIYALKFYHDELKDHFIREEEMRTLVTNLDTNLDDMLNRMLSEHRVLHELFGILQNDTEPSFQLDIVGKTLEDHIRFEERELFPLVQEKVNPEMMLAVQKLLARE